MSIQSFVKGENLTLNVTLLVVLVIATAVHFKVNVSKPVEEGEEKPSWVKHALFVLGASTLLVGATVATGVLAPSGARVQGDFDTRIANASSNLRDSLEDASSSNVVADVKDQFEQRVADAAKKLKESIQRTPSIVAPAPVPTGSSLAAQASAEIDRFISENS